MNPYKYFYDKYSYDKEYLSHAMFGIISSLNDLWEWSAYNKDKYNEEIHEIDKLVQNLAKKVGFK